MSSTTLKPREDRDPASDPPATGTTSYWGANLRLLGGLLAVWFVVSFGFGILLRDLLDRVSIFGVPAGFWFAQQGAIYVFIVLIFVYARAIHRIEQRHGVDDDDTMGDQA